VKNKVLAMPRSLNFALVPLTVLSLSLGACSVSLTTGPRENVSNPEALPEAEAATPNLRPPDNRQASQASPAPEAFPASNEPEPQIIARNQPLGVVKLPRQGGDMHHRWPTFVVPQASTAISAYGGAARWYDVHLATMVALTADQFCGNPAARGAYFNYEAEGGNVFMGQIFISCGSAREIISAFGQGAAVQVTLEEAGGPPEFLEQRIPNLTDGVMAQFRRQVVEQLTPECSDGSAPRCPGDRQ
jgi:hypothetical protein